MYYIYHMYREVSYHSRLFYSIYTGREVHCKTSNHYLQYMLHIMLTFPHQLKLLDTTGQCRIANMYQSQRSRVRILVGIIYFKEKLECS
jgi:hypothetical protein